MVSLRKRLAAATVVGMLAVAAPATANAAAPTLPNPLPPNPNLPNPLKPNPDLCLNGIVDPGPFGPLGPYGPSGPYGKDGPLHNEPNPLGNAATCGGLLTYILRGGNPASFVQASIAH
jgi:hypothetical protein